MNRFEKKKSVFHYLGKIKLSIVAFFVLFLVFLGGLHSVSQTTAEKQKESLQNAIQRSVVQCYAIEGMYPPSLAYLEEHYGLTYDSDLFFVDYQPVAANIMPDITILSREKE